MRKAFVTGATGFIGECLTSKLIAEGWEVHILVRETSKILKEANINRINIHVHDGSIGNLIDIIGVVKPSIVFHLASSFIAQHESKDVNELILSNILFPTQLLEAMNIAGVKGLINTGTSWQNYQSKAYDPVCLYAATKEAFEALIKYYENAHQFKVITLKLFDTYGPGDNRKKIFSLIKEASKEKRSLFMSKGEQLIDLVYVDDVVNAYLIAANRVLNNELENHEIYAVSSEERLGLKDLITLYLQITKIDVQIEWGARPYRIREVMIPWWNGKKLPGWTPKVSLLDGIQKIAKEQNLGNK